MTSFNDLMHNHGALWNREMSTLLAMSRLDRIRRHESHEGQTQGFDCAYTSQRSFIYPQYGPFAVTPLSDLPRSALRICTVPVSLYANSTLSGRSWYI